MQLVAHANMHWHALVLECNTKLYTQKLGPEGPKTEDLYIECEQIFLQGASML